jgi:hypothetical protein
VNEMTAAVELVQALGGGWNVSELPAAAKVTSKDAAQKVNEIPQAAPEPASTSTQR